MYQDSQKDNACPTICPSMLLSIHDIFYLPVIFLILQWSHFRLHFLFLNHLGIYSRKNSFTERNTFTEPCCIMLDAPICTLTRHRYNAYPICYEHFITAHIGVNAMQREFSLLTSSRATDMTLYITDKTRGVRKICIQMSYDVP